MEKSLRGSSDANNIRCCDNKLRMNSRSVPVKQQWNVIRNKDLLLLQTIRSIHGARSEAEKLIKIFEFSASKP